MNRVRVLLGDDHALILEGVRRLLESHFDVVGAESDGQALVKAALQLEPDLVVLDISMPILNGIDATREIKKALPAAKVIVLSMHSNAIYLNKALQAGASGYVLKSGASEELLTAIEAVGKGRSYVSPGFGRQVIDGARDSAGRPKRSVIELTGRQRQILQLVAEGKQNKEIAEILCVSIKTVEFHRSRLMAKLGARSIADLTRFAIQEGLTNVAD
jgi:DNA-binding NarL/FixJ family response regulator